MFALPLVSSSSPFQGIEEAAQDLVDKAITSIIQPRETKEQQLREGADQVGIMRRHLQEQLSHCITQLEEDRDRIIEAATARCQQLVVTLREDAARKDEVRWSNTSG